FLVGKVLGMHEGHVEELPFGRCQTAVETLVDRIARDLQCRSVCGEGVGAAAEHIAGKLVVDDDRGTRGTRFLESSVGDGLADLPVEAEKALADRLVRLRAYLEPVLRRQFLEPEAKSLV